MIYEESVPLCIDWYFKTAAANVIGITSDIFY